MGPIDGPDGWIFMSWFGCASGRRPLRPAALLLVSCLCFTTVAGATTFGLFLLLTTLRCAVRLRAAGERGHVPTDRVGVGGAPSGAREE